MTGRRRWVLRRASLVAAGFCLLLSLGSQSSAQEEHTVPRPEVFRGSASSLAASVQVDREALLPVPELFRFIALDGDGVYETSTQRARASVFFPGNGLILGPDLACGTFGGQFPAEFKPIIDACLTYRYPLTVFADEFQPDGATTGSVVLGAPGDPLSGNAGRAVAHAGEDAATTDAAIQDLEVLGMPTAGPVNSLFTDFEFGTALLSIDNATSRTTQRIVQGVLVVDSIATLSGVETIGGLVDIGSIRSSSHVTDDAKGKRSSVADLEVSGVTVAGVPAQITEDGLVVGTPAGGGPLGVQQQALANELLRGFDVRISTLGSEEDLDRDGAAVANVGGLLIEFARDVQLPLPGNELDPNGVYTGSIQLGQTGALGAAFSFPIEEGPTSVPILDGGLDGFGGLGTDGSATDASSVPELASPASVDASSGPEVTGGIDPAQQLARRVGALFGDRLGLLYLALMFSVLGLCIVPRLTVPARFPGSRS